MEDKSYMNPFLTKRITILIKKASIDENPTIPSYTDDERSKIGLLPMMLALTGLYAAFSKKVPKDSIKSIDNAIKGNRKLGLLIAATTGVGLGINAVARHTEENAFGKYDLGHPPGDYEDYKHSIRQRNMLPLTKQAYLSRIVFGVPAIYAASGIQKVRRAKDPYKKESAIGKAIRKYPDLLSVGLIGEKLMGSPISGAPSKAWQIGKRLIKRGSLSGATIGALAFPGPSMPLRAAMFAVDEGVFKGVGKIMKMIKRKKQKRSYHAEYR
ncbi:MAG: hypothetical protein DRQ88_13330 [Epsilonproteobacteria bacterium]|nr:MAG: hypothetical protein DRQ88_13330 [Campylobacterota bacterium]